MKQVMRIGKTSLLILLVGASIVLSYFVWSGNFQQGTELGIVQSPALPTAQTPDMAHAIRPYMVVGESAEGQTLIRPDTAAYKDWCTYLKQTHAYDPTPIPSLPTNARASVKFLFGMSINKTIAAPWLQGTGVMLNSWLGRSVVIYTLPGDSACRLAYVGENQIISMKTDLSAKTFLTRTSTDVLNNPYDVWNHTTDADYVPRKLQMNQLIYSVRQPDTLPLVHSFFVNPEATTRIAQDSSTVLWTDGSRAVQVNGAQDELQYEDPNGSQIPLNNNAFKTTMDFIHSHGGGAQDVIAFDFLGQLNMTSDTPSFVFTQYVDGYPILSDSADYAVSVENGRVMEYRRPLWVLQKVVKSKAVPILNKAELTKKLKQLDHDDTPSDLDLVLGYAALWINSSHQQLKLQPVYLVTSRGGSTWTINAQTGTLLSGSDGT